MGSTVETAAGGGRGAFGADLHCSLGDGRSYTDPVTNWTLISGVQLERDLARMMQAGRYPRSYLPDFVHELVHHWCFHSPVGTALALLQLRARRNAILLDAGGERSIDGWSVLDDVVRYETAIAQMRPLAEGLALYGEFDALPGDSPIISQVMLQALIAFVNPNAAARAGDPSLAGGGRELADLLASIRCSDMFEKRKANLLVQPLDTGHGGYLPGYLTVKNLWYTLVQRMPDKFTDTDLYLQFMRSFFYGDYGYVAVLLDPERKISAAGAGPVDSADAISDYFQRRWLQLRAWTTEAEVSRYEAAVLAGADQAEVPLGADPALVRRGRELLQGLVSEIDFDGPADTLEKQLLRMDHWTLAQRDLMCVGSFAAAVRVNDRKRVLVSEPGPGSRIPVFAMEGLSGIEPDSGEGSLEFFLSPEGRYSVLTVTLHDRLVGVGSLSENFTDALREQVVGYRTSHARAAAEGRLWRSVVTSVLGGNEVHEIYLDHYRRNARRVADAMYLPKALLFTPDETLDRAVAATRDKGLYCVLGESYDLVRGAARLSLVSGIDMRADGAIRHLASAGIDAEAVLAALRRCEEETGLVLVAETGGFLFCYF